MNFKILNTKEKKKILDYLKKQYGAVVDLDYIFIKKKDKIYLLSNEFRNFDLGNLHINSSGLYFLKEDRLSVEGSQLIGKKAKKNVVELNKTQIEKWVMGWDIEIKGNYQGYVLVKYKDDFYGSGNYKDGRIKNFIPKSRRIKT